MLDIPCTRHVQSFFWFVYGKAKHEAVTCREYCRLFAALIRHPSYLCGRLDKAKTLLVLGHWRSGSTLLSHILHSNPELCGNVETHLSYRSKFAIRVLWAFLRARVSSSFDPSRQYAVDKVVDPRLYVSRSFVRACHPKIIFLVREPVATISSQVHTFQQNIDCAVHFYRKRLRQLRKVAKQSATRENSCAFRYGDLVDNSDAVLRGLTYFLRLSKPLAPTYVTTELTGRQWFGDPGPVIHSGKICKVDEPVVNIPPAVLAFCQKEYDETWALLKSTCNTFA